MKIYFCAEGLAHIQRILQAELPEDEVLVCAPEKVVEVSREADVLIPTVSSIGEDALRSSRLKLVLQYGAGLDVFWYEPFDPTDPIFAHNVIVTPHVGAMTDLSVQGIAKKVAENVNRLRRGEPLLNCVNKAIDPPLDPPVAPGQRQHSFHGIPTKRDEHRARLEDWRNADRNEEKDRHKIHDTVEQEKQLTIERSTHDRG